MWMICAVMSFDTLTKWSWLNLILFKYRKLSWEGKINLIGEYIFLRKLVIVNYSEYFLPINMVIIEQ